MHHFKTVINHFSKGPYANVERLWDYVTGLRGNDDGSHDFKRYVTTVIRGEVSGCAWGYSENYINDSWDNTTHERYVTLAFATVSSHSISHAVLALRALSEYYADKGGRINLARAGYLYSMADSVKNRDARSYIINLIAFHNAK